MAGIKKKNIKEICNLIDLIIANKDNRIDYKYIFLHLDKALTRKINYDEIALICETTIKIAKTKNRIIRHLEKDFWSFIKRVPNHIIGVYELDIRENEELLSNTAYDQPGKRILSRLTGFVLEIINLKDDNSKGSDLRRASSLNLLARIIDFYNIPFAKNMFVSSINSKNKSEQYEALLGLENYYDVSEDEIEDDLIKILNVIKAETDDRTVASTCLQIQINAGIIDEMIAISEIDDWEDEDYYKRLRKNGR